jgi:hypothetical protein
MPITTAQPADAEAVTALAVAAGLFPAEAAGVVTELMNEYFAGKAAIGNHRCVVDVTEGSGGIAAHRELRAVA